MNQSLQGQTSLAGTVGATIKKSLSGLKPSCGTNLSSILFDITKKLDFQVSHVENFDNFIKAKIGTLKKSIVLCSPIVKSVCSKSNQDLCQSSDVHHWSHHSLKPPLRLRNTGNSCYLNAVLQCVLATVPLIGFCEIKHKEPEKCPLSSKGRLCYVCELGRLVKAQRINNQIICPVKFLSNIKSVMRSLSYDNQEDAHEYFLGFLSKMEQNVLVGYEHLSVEVKDTNPIRLIFGGVTRSQVICQSCHNVSSRDEQMFNLSLDITKSQTIKECLENYTRVEHLKGANAYKCESCAALRHAKRHVTIQESPKILTIQFNRFSRFHKIDSSIQFPIQLDIRPFMTQKDGPPVTYKLYATVNHKGTSCRSGHYVAYTRRINQWQCLDDDEIRSIGTNEVLRSHPYLLYYERIDTSGPSQSRAQTSPNHASSKCYSTINDISSPQSDKREPVMNGYHKISLSPKNSSPPNCSPDLHFKKKQASIIQGDVGSDIRPIFQRDRLAVATSDNVTVESSGRTAPNKNSNSDRILSYLNGNVSIPQWQNSFSPPEILVKKRCMETLTQSESLQNGQGSTDAKRIKLELSPAKAYSAPPEANASPPVIHSTTYVKHNPNHISASVRTFPDHHQRGNNGHFKKNRYRHVNRNHKDHNFNSNSNNYQSRPRQWFKNKQQNNFNKANYSFHNNHRHKQMNRGYV